MSAFATAGMIISPRYTAAEILNTLTCYGNVVVSGNLSVSGTTNNTGNLSGNLVGSVFGNVVGNVTGNLNGAVFGNVVGNVTGNLNGTVTGNLFGRINSVPLASQANFANAVAITAAAGEATAADLTTTQALQATVVSIQQALRAAGILV